MNYLGHAFLSFGDAEILTGNMIGDYVKGRVALNDYPEGIQKGILLHRKIDSFTDTFPSVQRAAVWFRQHYGLYSGAIVDTLFDHYLATDPAYFKTEDDLLGFTQDVYKKLEQHKEFFPPKFAAMFPYMKEQNWLYNYRHMMGAQRSLQGLQRRAKHMQPVDDAYRTFVVSYYEIGQCYYEFIEKVYKFVNDELKGPIA
ncbi:MAG: DUF479 domain-containing protein [Chitinophagaceae bacterium]|nr:DUF479 domain-containing protein [Chitinophagaceae bacterium]